ncbi:MAG: sulfatase [Anaerolineae bacterium]|nr:sulfatase [Anaerolineae bacterium]
MAPNVVFVFGDQWRAQACGYAGNATVKTPHLDHLAGESINLTHAISGWPVCTPWRATFLTGQYPLTHGVFVNDVSLSPDAVTIGKVYRDAGYDTAYIGKWHVDGHGRSNYIPPQRHQGFGHWQVLECTHDYNASAYYEGTSDRKNEWDGYDATAQTRAACDYIRKHDRSKPFFLVLSWGPPHNPYETAPQAYRDLYDPAAIALRPNVPEDMADEAREWLAGYYAHCTALDACAGNLLATLDETGLAENTIFVFTSDHGDMLGSHGMVRKQKPWDESIRVPFLLRWPGRFGRAGRTADALINAHDIMPTLLSLCEINVPESVEGLDFSAYLDGGADPGGGAALLACFHPFGEWDVAHGGREFRGLRTHRHTYVRDLDGPWLLYDNESDPYQMENLVGKRRMVQAELEQELEIRLAALGDEFQPGSEYIRQWGYTVDETGTVPYTS